MIVGVFIDDIIDEDARIIKSKHEAKLAEFSLWGMEPSRVPSAFFGAGISALSFLKKSVGALV